ncbi:MAG: hypothetical protein QOD30_199 [Actinomycetota bacterium]|nr:hypothetical protein [Actinomycetota bacterium]
MWSRTDLAPSYANRDLRAVETTILLRYRDDLAGRVLELGCGAGRLTGHLLDVASDVEVLDVSLTMLEACLGAYPAAHGVLGDIRDLSGFPDAAYDAIVAGYGLIDVVGDVDRRATLAEMRRMLVPNGLLVLSTHNRDAGADTPLARCRRGVRDFINVAVGAPRWIPNRLRLTKYEREEPGYAIWNDSSHDYGALHYYITRDDEQRQLADLGFAIETCLDLDGREVSAGARSTSAELHFLARSPARP